MGQWPTVTYEEREWTGHAPVPASRRAMARARGPYLAAVVPAIAHQEVTLPGDVLAAADDAAAEIGRFDGQMGAEIAPFSAILLRSESAASSRIENLTASARAIAEAGLGPGSPNAAMIVANERSMTAAVALADTLDEPAILGMHEALLRDSAPAIAGRWRVEQVWIGGGNLSPHGAAFVPPHHERVGAAVADLVRFMSRTDIPVMVHVALAHAQFETIHPFSDGNGRVGRALVHAQLRHARLTRHVTQPVSAGLLADVEAYFAALDSYRAGDVEPIVRRFVEATFASLANGETLIAELRAMRTRWEAQMRARRDSAAWKVLDLVVRHPVVNAALMSRELGVAPANVYRVLRPLVAAGVLVESTNARRGRMWRAPEVLGALDDFAARAGRRSRPG